MKYNTSKQFFIFYSKITLWNSSKIVQYMYNGTDNILLKFHTEICSNKIISTEKLFSSKCSFDWSVVID